MPTWSSTPLACTCVRGLWCDPALISPLHPKAQLCPGRGWGTQEAGPGGQSSLGVHTTRPHQGAYTGHQRLLSGRGGRVAGARQPTPPDAPAPLPAISKSPPGDSESRVWLSLGTCRVGGQGRPQGGRQPRPHLPRGHLSIDTWSVRGEIDPNWLHREHILEVSAGAPARKS